MTAPNTRVGCLPRQACSRGLLLAVACLLLAGCATRTQRQAEAFVVTAVNRRFSSLGGTPGMAETGPVVFTFRQACERSAKFDQDVAAAFADVSRLQLDSDQARSERLPRLDVGTYFQIPFGGRDLEGVRIFSGGLFFRYDFERALFSGDANAAARARIVERRENLQSLLDRLSANLFAVLADREALRAEVVARRDIQTQTSNATERAQLLARAGRIKPDRVLELQYQRENATRWYQDATRRLAAVNRSLAGTLMIEGSKDIVITDLTELASSMESVSPPVNPDTQFFTGVWGKRHDARAAEANLFVKEMAVVEKRRKRIPNITASFGLGSVNLTSSFQQAPVVIQLGATMPLLNFGDIKREVEKASIERDLARKNISLMLLRLQRSVLDASAALSEAAASHKALENQRRLVFEQSESSKKLLAAGMLDPIDLLDFRVRISMLDIELAKERSNLSKAAADYALASGRPLADGLAGTSEGK